MHNDLFYVSVMYIVIFFARLYLFYIFIMRLISNKMYRCSVILDINARQNNALPAIDDLIETIKLRSRGTACILRSFTTSLRRRYELDTGERTKYALI